MLAILFYLFIGIVAIQLFYYLFVFGKFAYMKSQKSTPKKVPISVIVCAKNEEENVIKFIPILAEQDYPDYEVVLSLDDERSQYILRRVGWSGTKRIHYTDLHLALRNGKIWIEEDWTKDGFATDLLEAGVPNEDIVLGFQPPEMRIYTEFAVA